VAAPAAVGTLLGALPPERAGVGSAVNDTVQQIGSALSVAVLGSVLTTAYRAAMPPDTTGPARDSLGDALGVATATGDAGLAEAARAAFVDAIAVTSLIGVVGGIAAAILAASVLRPKPATDPGTADPLSTEAETAKPLSTDPDSEPVGIERPY
jgi:hypothetical protein